MDLAQKIYEIGYMEMHNVQEFPTENVIFYRGFRISKNIDGYYEWYDTRYSNYYEMVTPDISNRILEVGFEQTLTEVMVHSDERKIIDLSREMEVKDAIVSYWVKESTKLWATYQKDKDKILSNKKLSTDEIKKQLRRLDRKLETKKALYQKKRRVVLEEKEVLKQEKRFYEARQKLYSNFKFKH